MLNLSIELFAIIGAISVSFTAFRFLFLLARTASLGNYKYRPQLASWAVVTGASDGIGKQVAIELSKLGYKVVLIVRSRDKLKATADEIKTETKIIPFDFYKPSNEKWEELKKELDRLEIGVLVNNAGISHDFPVSFLDEDLGRVEQILSVNVDSLMKMTRIVLPQMVNRKHGLVLNIGSMLGKITSSLLSVYSASKSYVHLWSKCLAQEVKDKGVHVEYINTLFVQTAMSKIRKSSVMVPTPKAFAKSILANCGASIDSTPYLPHAIADFLLGFIPESIITSQSNKMHQDIRKRALKKLEKSK